MITFVSFDESSTPPNFQLLLRIRVSVLRHVARLILYPLCDFFTDGCVHLPFDLRRDSKHFYLSLEVSRRKPV